MPRLIRIFAVGLMMAGLMSMFVPASWFVTWALRSELIAWAQALGSVSDAVYATLTTAISVIVAGTFWALYLGLGLWGSAVIYAPLDHWVAGAIDAWCYRHDDSDYARTLRAQYLSWLPTRFR